MINLDQLLQGVHAVTYPIRIRSTYITFNI